jgi:TonB-linked SusC/RagA family outer membrane protein
MKKNCIGGRGIPILRHHIFFKIFLIMKITLLITLLTTLQVSANVYSQNVKLTLDIKEMPLAEVVKTIEQQSSYRFFYSDNYRELGELVSINVSNKNIDEVLSDLLKEKDLDFRILDNNVIVIAPTKAFLQQKVTGTITDAKTGEPLPGVTIMVEGTTKGVTTDLNGNYSIEVTQSTDVLVFSYVGYIPEKVNVGGQTTINVMLVADIKLLGEVVVVGYGSQKKESVVGSITQTTGKTLERIGVTNLGNSLTGNLPGVTTISSSGMPGAEDPQIIIRGASSWNGSSPLILVDGIERSMSSVDITSVESISVLKDASATAVYGVKGANGVILITTKRGKEGKANIQIHASATAKTPSKLPEKYDSYDALKIKNEVIERELSITPSGWSSYTPMEIINKYRNPANAEEWDRYPNVDWQKELFKDYAMSYNVSANASGGSKIVSYFAAVDFVNEGDLFKKFNTGRGYVAGYGYNRINVRSNLDFNLTKTTKFSTNLFGSNAVRTTPWGYTDGDASYWRAIYRTAPDAMRPIYSDGTYGYYNPKDADQPNSVSNLAAAGIEKKTTTRITTDFVLNQELGMFVKGLTFKANLSMDNSFLENHRGVNDSNNKLQRKWINPVNGEVRYESDLDTGTQLDFTEQNRWSAQGGEVDVTQTYRKFYYSLQLNYGRQFGNHNVTALGLFSRDKSATGSEFNHYREDWVFRATYDYATKYFFEVNGAYNGSEKFSSDNRFAFFPSLSLGWLLSNEEFVKNLGFIDVMKLRGSWGRIGDDSAGDRFLYSDQWSYGGAARMGDIASDSPYKIYRIKTLGNENVSWETVEKRNFGVDYAFLHGLVSGSFDVFRDRRYDILTSTRAVASYFGQSATVANVGEVKTHGHEFELKLNHTFGKDLRLWLSYNMTHAVNKIIYADDPELKPDYQKKEGYAINQTTAYLNQGTISSWDDVYGSTVRSTNNTNKESGDYNIVDVNGDGKIDSYDKTPYGYSTTPQNTYSTTLGFEWKGLSTTVQFYGVSNVTREVYSQNFYANSNVVYKEGNYYTKTSDGLPSPRLSTTVGEEAAGTRYLYDGSYLRLKNVEIGYTFQGNLIKKLRMQSFRFYLSGNNLIIWTDMPDDRESNSSTNGNSADGAYPTMKRFNLGIDITL